MQITSDVYKDLLARGAAKEVRVEIGGEIYGEDRLVEVTTSGGLFSADTLCVGSAVSKQIDLSVVDYGDIPRMAKIIPSYRLVMGEEVSEWVQKGVFYIDTRQPDKTSGVLTIHGFDAMLKSSVIWIPDQSLVFPMTRRAAAIAISDAMGVVLDNPYDIDDTQPVVDYPANDYTQRDVLRFIAASHASNFVITDLGKLRMVPINAMAEETGYLVNEIGKTILIGGVAIRVASVEGNNFTGSGDKAFVGPNVSSSGAAPAFDPVSKIVLKVDSENAVVSGDDFGTTIEADCPYATQDIADDLIQKVRGFVYRPFTAEDAIVDPSIELGDGITVDGVYTMLIRQELRFDGLMTSRIASPGEFEVESEFPYQTKEQQINYRLSATGSRISKTADQIRLEVFGEDGYSGSSITAQIDSINLGVKGALGTDKDGNLISVSSSIETALSGIEMKVTNGETSSTIMLKYGDIEIESPEIKMSGVVTFEGLESGKTTIDGGWITTDSLTVDALHLSGILTIYSGLYTAGYEYVGGYIGYDAGFNSSMGIGIRDTGGRAQVVCTNAATRISFGDPQDIRVGGSQVVCNDGSVLVEGHSIITFKTLGGDRLQLDSNALTPTDSALTCGTASAPWYDVYAAGTSMSDLLSRVEALEGA